MGIMATGSTRRLRGKLHKLFDVIWQEGYLTRIEAYIWLANQINFKDKEDCHIGYLSKEQLRHAILVLSANNTNDYVLFKRRKEKNDERVYARRQRQGAKIDRRKSSNRFKPNQRF